MRRNVTLVALSALVALGAAATWQLADDPVEDPSRPASPTPPVTAPATVRGSASTAPTGQPSAAASASPDVTGGFVMWGRGEITADTAVAAAGLEHVTAVAHVRADTLGLVATYTEDGRVVDRWLDGFRVPVDVAAVDPGTFAAILPPGPDREAIAALRPGHVLLTDDAAARRGIGPGGAVDLAGRPGLRVAGAVSDGLVGRGELIVHAAEADAVGLEPDGTLHVRHEAPDDRATAALGERLQALVEDGPTRVVDLSSRLEPRRGPLVLSLGQVKDRFGEFAYRPREGQREIELDPAFVDEHIVTARVPVIGPVTCHEDIFDDLTAAMLAIEEAGLAGEIDPERYAGCFYPRRISTSGDRLSHHAWGIALDINVDLSQPGLGPPPPPEVVDIFEAHGFRWGGDFITPDNHHFEWVGDRADDPLPPRYR